jgi:vacuolar-type H+-ATPase subunit I/STV1
VENIIKLIDIFDFKNILIKLCIIEKNSLLFQKLEEQKFKYYKYNSYPKRKNKSQYFHIVFATSPDDLKKLLKVAFEYDIEAITCQNMIAKISESFSFENYVYIDWTSMRKLINNKTSDVCFSIITEEDAVGIAFSREVYDKKQILSKINTLKL